MVPEGGAGVVHVGAKAAVSGVLGLGFVLDCHGSPEVSFGRRLGPFGLNVHAATVSQKRGICQFVTESQSQNSKIKETGVEIGKIDFLNFLLKFYND